MKCPTDGSTLTMSERSGIEIDYCPECRGVWLDRGELDKILDRATAETPAAPPAPPTAAAPVAPAPRRDEPRYDDRRYDDDRRRNDRRYDDRRYDDRGYPRRKKKEHWLSELFD